MKKNQEVKMGKPLIKAFAFAVVFFASMSMTPAEAFVGVTPDPFNCDFSGYQVRCDPVSWTSKSGTASFYFGYSTAAVKPTIASGFAVQGVQGSVVGGSLGGGVQNVNWETVKNSLGTCAAWRWITLLYVDSATMHKSNVISLPQGACSGAPINPAFGTSKFIRTGPNTIIDSPMNGVTLSATDVRVGLGVFVHDDVIVASSTDLVYFQYVLWHNGELRVSTTPQPYIGVNDQGYALGAYLMSASSVSEVGTYNLQVKTVLRGFSGNADVYGSATGSVFYIEDSGSNIVELDLTPYDLASINSKFLMVFPQCEFTSGLAFFAPFINAAKCAQEWARFIFSPTQVLLMGVSALTSAAPVFLDAFPTRYLIVTVNSFRSGYNAGVEQECMNPVALQATSGVRVSFPQVLDLCEIAGNSMIHKVLGWGMVALVLGSLLMFVSMVAAL